MFLIHTAFKRWQWCLLCTACAINWPVAAEHGDPSVAAQLQLEAINRARLNPQAEAQRLGLSSVTEGGAKVSTDPVPPLAMNATLTRAALKHSKDMAEKDYFSHSSQSGGASPFERIRAAGYNFSTAAENIAVTTYGNTEEQRSLQMHDNLFIDDGISGRGHRVNLLSDSYREIGIGLATGDFRGYTGTYLTSDFGRNKEQNSFFLLGVAYKDDNQDGQYSAGEALSGIELRIQETGDSTQTASAGGYSVALAEGQYTVVFSHKNLGSVQRHVRIDQANVKLDLLHSDFADVGNDTPSTPTVPSTQGENPELQQHGEQLKLVLPFVSVANDKGGQDYWHASLNWDGSAFVLETAQPRSDTPRSAPAQLAQFFVQNEQTLVLLPTITVAGQNMSVLLNRVNNRFEVLSAQAI